MAALVLIGVLDRGVFGGDDGDGGGQMETTAAGGDTGDSRSCAPRRRTGPRRVAVAFAQTEDQPVLQINLTGLAPTSADNIYIVWLYNSERAAFPWRGTG